jgi:8-oxo-dGTP pyrophosphatase MutT (NUDIX family)
VSTAGKPWTTLASRTVYENPWMRVAEDKVVTAGGVLGVYGVVRHPTPGCCILPLDAEGCTWIVGQYRYAIGRYTWELPAGMVGGDGDPLIAAQRELSEETGLSAARWHSYLRLAPVNSVTNLELFCFVAWHLTPGTPHPDDGEELTLRRLPFRDVLEMVLTGEITSASGVAAVLQAHILALRGRMPPEVTAALRAGQ